MRRSSSWQRRERASRKAWERAGFVDEIFGGRYLCAIYEVEVEQLKLSLVRSGHRGLEFMAWAKSKAFLEKLQLSSMVLYLICLGGYAIPPVRGLFEEIQKAAHFKVVEISGFTFFSLFVASTVLLRLEEGAADAPASAQAEAS